jgi:hypothetical protein
VAFFRKSRRPAGLPRSPFRGFFWIALLGFLAMAGFGIQEIVTEMRAGRWPQVPCEIQCSGVSEQSRGGSPGFIVTVRYTYQWEGRIYISDHIRIKPELIHSSVADAEARAAKFPKGARLQCHVNPANPREAILECSPDYVALAISPFLLVIWALYERTALADWFERQRWSRRGTGRQPITANRALRRAKAKPLVVGLLGLAMSLAFAGFLWVWPWREQRAAHAWQATPCKILHAGVVTETTHQGGRFFKPQVVYQYEFQGVPHKGSQLDFSADMDFNYARIRKLVRAYHAGETSTCFVNPANPGQAVLRRRFRADPFFSLFTAGFLGLSVFLIVQGLPRKPRLSTVNPWEDNKGGEAVPAGEKRLQPEIQAAPRLALSLIGLVPCVGFAVWLLHACWQSLRQGGLDLLPLLYGCGAAVGAFFCAKYAWRYGRSLSRRGPSLKLTPAIITPGQSFSVEWEWPREARNPAFRLCLEGVEAVRMLSEVATQHGPSREEKTQEWVFFTMPLTAGEHPETSAFGQARGVLPPLTMHSFEGLKTKVLWRIRADFPEPGAASLKYKVVVRPPLPGV